MSLFELINRRRCRPRNFDGQCEENPFRYIEIWTNQGSNLSMIKDDALPCDKLDDWLYQKGEYLPSQEFQSHESAGLRLLILQWQGYQNKYILPCSRKTLDKLLDAFNLPKNYPHDFVNRQYDQYLPPRLQKIQTSAGTNFAIICQSPRFPDSFITMALSYNPASNITSSLLGFTTSSKANSRLDPLLKHLKQAALNAAHPMLLPLLTYNCYYQILEIAHRNVDTEIRTIQQSTGLMKEYYFKEYGAVQSFPTYKDFTEIHSRLVEQHAYLFSSLPYFVDNLSLSTLRVLDELKDALPPENRTFLAKSDAELRDFLIQIRGRVEIEMQYKKMLLDSLDMQLKVLYSLMQQQDSRTAHEIAIEAKRDSSVMKSIAFLTMVFLPGTAVATIFSMSPFFTSTPDKPFVASSQFWIYWAVTIPLTIIVLVSFLVWLNRGLFLKQKQDDSERGGDDHLPSSTNEQGQWWRSKSYNTRAIRRPRHLRKLTA